MKLSGDQYLSYWRKRMAIGPDEASFNGNGADHQGEVIWSFIVDRLTGMKPQSLLDFGCGYGRMLRKLHTQWPKTKLYGVDLCQVALDHTAHDKNWFECGKPKLARTIPKGLTVDLVFDCLALQHVTDESIFLETVESFRALLTKRGRIVLFENVSRPGAEHVRDMSTDDFMGLWPELKWMNCGTIDLGHQGHALMIGSKKP